MDYAEATDRLYAIEWLDHCPPRTLAAWCACSRATSSSRCPPRLPGPGTQSFVAHARWVFANAAGDMLHVVVQADGSAGAADDFAVWSVGL